jgi:hypothetical protein
MLMLISLFFFGDALNWKAFCAECSKNFTADGNLKEIWECYKKGDVLADHVLYQMMEMRNNLARGIKSNPGNYPILLEALQNKDESIRCIAALCLGYYRVSNAVPALIKLLSCDPVEGVRQCAAEALGRIGNPSAIPALQKAITDKSPMIRGTATSSLLKLKGQKTKN